MINGWTDNCFATGTAGIASAPNGVVHLRGAICRSTGTSTQPFVLPAKYRPTENDYVTVDECNAYTGRLLIEPDGTVFVHDDPSAATSGPSACFTSLAGANYTLPY